MHLAEFECDGFRALRDVRFRPATGVNVIRGENAQGKTSLLEAILFLATSKSHRTNSESELVRHGADRFHLRGRARWSDREVVLETNWWQGAKRVKVDGVPVARVSDILGKMGVVFFSPEDVELVKGSAAARRRFMDMELSQLDARYLVNLQNYRNVLRQRNELLRKLQATGKRDDTLLELWEQQLAEHGGALMEERRGFLARLSELATDAHARIAGGEELRVEYRPDVKESGALGETWAAVRAADLRNGVTGRGPHRDDMDLVVGGRPAGSYGSQGQQKTAALALKLAEIDVVRERAGEYPVLMLDEVLAELDHLRSGRLVDAIPADVQCLMTTAEGRGLLRGSRQFRIREGRLEEE